MVIMFNSQEQLIEIFYVLCKICFQSLPNLLYILSFTAYLINYAAVQMLGSLLCGGYPIAHDIFDTKSFVYIISSGPNEHSYELDIFSIYDFSRTCIFH